MFAIRESWACKVKDNICKIILNSHFQIRKPFNIKTITLNPTSRITMQVHKHLPYLPNLLGRIDTAPNPKPSFIPDIKIMPGDQSVPQTKDLIPQIDHLIGIPGRSYDQASNLIQIRQDIHFYSRSEVINVTKRI